MKEVLSKQAVKLAKQAEEHERFINKVGLFCLISDSRIHHLWPFGYANIEQASILMFVFLSFYECSGDSFFGGSWLWLVLLHLWGK